jgi:AcrR family transcriptional regulator
MAKRSTQSDHERSQRIREWVAEWTAAQQERDRDRPHKPDDDLPIWQYLSRPPKGPRPALTHDQIAAAAVELADEAGLDAVTMRALAKRLNVATMGLYRYIRSKDDVSALMLNAVIGEIAEPPERAGEWRTTMRQLAHEMRAQYLRHTWLPRLEAGSYAMLSPNALAVAEAGVAALDALDLDLDVDHMMASFSTLSAFVRGSATTEIAQRDAYSRYGWSSDDDMRAAVGPRVMWMMVHGDYPTLARYIVDGSNEDDADWGFAFGLECVLDGIAARLGI